MTKSNLFGDLSNQVTVSEIELSKISTNPNQPRKIFDKSSLKDLADSIKEHGLIQPIVVSETEDGEFIIVAGERRFRASQINKATTINAIIRSEGNNDVIAIVENVQRDNLKPVEEARAIAKLIDDKGISQNEVGKMIGKRRKSINQLLKINSLPEEVQDESLDLNISKTLLIELAQVKDQDTVSKLWKKAKDGNLKIAEIRATKTKKKGQQEKASKLAPTTKAIINKGNWFVNELEKVNLDTFTEEEKAQLNDLKLKIDQVFFSLTSE